MREGTIPLRAGYREHMQTYAEMGVLGMWDERIDAESLNFNDAIKRVVRDKTEADRQTPKVLSHAVRVC